MAELRQSRFPDRDRNDEGRAENARPRDRFGRPLPRGAVDELSDREEPDEVVATLDEALARAASLFDDQRFFEAHEFLEWCWKCDEVAPGDRDFWKGVTQVAVGCAHTQRGNGKGALTLLERAIGYMAPYPESYQGVDHGGLAAVARSVAAQVRARGASPDVDFPSFPLA
jgi:predicted metal-dependent hydrolase